MTEAGIERWWTVLPPLSDFFVLNMLRMIIWSLFLLLAIPRTSFTSAQEGTVLKETCQVFTFQFKHIVDDDAEIDTNSIGRPEETSIEKLKEFITEKNGCSKTKQDFDDIVYKTQGFIDPIFNLIAEVSFIINPLDNVTSLDERQATPIVCQENVKGEMGNEQERLIALFPLDISGTIQRAVIVSATALSCCQKLYGETVDPCCRCCKLDFIEYSGKCACPVGKFLDINVTKCELCPEDTYQPENASSTCKLCPKGTTTYTSTGAKSQSACRKACSPGERFNLSSKSCTPCPRNTFQPLQGQLGCEPCPKNTLTNNTGNQSPDDCVQSCNPGDFYNFTSANCESCPRNSYQQSAGQFNCIPCKESRITLKSGSNRERDCILECQEGSFYDFNISNCRPCPLNHYQNLTRQLNCTSCPNDKITINVSTSTVQDCIENCPPGSSFNYTILDCQKCPLNLFQPQPGKTKCRPCPYGKITSSPGARFSNSCFIECKQGSYYNFDTASCRPCPLNYYQNLTGQFSCNRCPEDKITINNSSSRVQDCIKNCAPGSVFNYTILDCQKCPLNLFQPQPGKTKCKPCPDGKITSFTGARFSNSCFIACDPGQFYNFSSNKCEKCKINSYQQFRRQIKCTPCEPGTITVSEGSENPSDCIPNCDAGMQYSVDMLKCVVCPLHTYKPTRGETGCIPCPKGNVTYKENNTKLTDCAEECKAGEYFNTTSWNCTKCPRNTTQHHKGQIKCLLCPNGEITEEEGTVHEKDCFRFCDAGEYHYNVTRDCLPCKQNTYQPSRRQFGCLPCPNGTLTLNIKSTSAEQCITNCLRGFYYNYTLKACVACPLATFQPFRGQDQCRSCFPGLTTQTNGSKYENACFPDCPEGFFYNFTLESCVECSLGEYQPYSGQTRCFKCSSGQTTLKTGSIKSDVCFKDCKKGSYYNTTLQRCILCPLGEYQPSRGQEKCLKCPTILTTYQTGRVDITACSVGCNPGKYYNATAEKCESCPVNTYQSSFAATTCNPCPNNKITTKIDRQTVEDCVVSESSSSPEIDVMETITIVIPTVGIIVVLLLALICFFQRRMKSNEPRRMSTRPLDTNSSFTDSSPGLNRPKLDSDVSMAIHHYKMEGSGLKPADGVLRPNSRTINIPKDLEIPRDSLKFVGEVLGKGNFGRVEKAQLLKDGKETVVAVKMIKGGGSFGDEKELYDELEILASLSPHPHPNIVNLVGGTTFDDGPLFVAVEYCANGNLLKYLQKNQTQSKPNSEYVNILPKATKPAIEYHWKLNKALEICSGMTHLAKHKVIHRDVAARNVLLDGQLVAKISDFGMARDIYVQQIYRKDTEGFLPVRWMAIESLESFIYTSQSDVWSFGILMWEIITDGRVPYNNILDHNQLLSYIKSGRIMKRPKSCPKDYYNIMEKCWGKDPSARPKFENLMREIQIMYDNELRKDEALPQRIFRKFSSKRKRRRSEEDEESHEGGPANGKLRLQNTLSNTSGKSGDKIEEEQLFSKESSPGGDAMNMQVLETLRYDDTSEEDCLNNGYDSTGSVTSSPNSPDVRETEPSEEVGKSGETSEMDESRCFTDQNDESLIVDSRSRSDSSSEQETEERDENASRNERFPSLGPGKKAADNIHTDTPSNLASDFGPVVTGDELVYDCNDYNGVAVDNSEMSSSMDTDANTGFSEYLAADKAEDAGLEISSDQENQVS